MTKLIRKNLIIFLILAIVLGIISLSGCDDTNPPGIGDGPVISLIGESSVTILQHESYVDAGAAAADTTDGDLSASIVVDNPVNTEIPGTYTVTYSCTNSADQSTTATRSVTVQDVPDTLLGTVALPEHNAVLDVDFSAPSRSLYSGSGRLRILGSDINISSASWDSETGAVAIASDVVLYEGVNTSFSASGTFTDGIFSGTLTLTYGVDQITGSVQAVDYEPKAATPIDVKRYVGALWGGNAGSWNMTIADGVIYGAYYGYYANGIITGTEDSNSLEISEGEVTTADGTVSGNVVRGNWTYCGPASGNQTVSGDWAGVRVDDSTGDPVSVLPVDPSYGKYLAVLGQAMYYVESQWADAGYVDGTYTYDSRKIVLAVRGNTSTYTFTDYIDTNFNIEVDGTWVSIGNSMDPLDIDVEANITLTEGGEATEIDGDFNVSGSAPPPVLTGTFDINETPVDLMLLELWYENYFYTG